MRDSVLAAAKPFQTKWEGRCNFLYVDRLGLVTTAIGNLVDPVALALTLPWLRNDNGAAATLNMIQDEWIRVKDRQDLRGAPIGEREAITTLHLADADVDLVFERQTEHMWSEILAGYPDADTWPAASQLATLSMSWAMGTGRIIPGSTFQYPHFRAAALAQSWGICAQECKMNGVGIDGRNASNKALFLFAAKGGDPEALPPLQ